MVARVSASKSAQVSFGILIIASMLLLTVVILPIWKPLFMAAVLAAALTPVNEWLVRKFNDRPRIASAVTTFVVFSVLVIPLVILGIVVVGEAIDAFQFIWTTLEAGGVSGLVAHLPASVEEPLRDLVASLPAEVQSLEDLGIGDSKAAGFAASVLTGVTAMIFDLGIGIITFHALLRHGRDLIAWILRISPLPETGELLAEARRVSGFVLRSSVATALIQGAVGTIGFFIASVPYPLFFGMLMFFAAFIPSVGTGLVSLPLVGLLALSGLIWQPIFLGVWSILAIGLVDNLITPLLIRNGVRLNGVLILLSLIGGMLVFGGIGLILGPLALTFFLAMVRLGYRDYVEAPQGTILAPS